MAKEKALVLYSGGLDSRLVVKLMQDKGYSVEALHFSLPFGCERSALAKDEQTIKSTLREGCCNTARNFNFTQKEEAKLTIIDCSKSPILEEYLQIIESPKHGIGSGVNPCRDCKIWMFKKAKDYAEKNKIKIIATGEVTGQRPMSQSKSAMQLIDKSVGMSFLRPLNDVGCKGRQRKIQMQLAEKYNIKYPTPSGGCLLCEKYLAERIKFLIKNKFVNEKNITLTKIGRHFIINKEWFIVARNEKESLIIEQFNSLPSDIGTPAVYYQKDKKTAEELQKAYKDKQPTKFQEFKI